MECIKCGNKLTSSIDNFGLQICHSCELKEKYHNYVEPVYPGEWRMPVPQYGWACPKCGSVYAPHVMECSRCNPPQKLEITCLNEEDGQC
jgi:hypothetical protein